MELDLREGRQEENEWRPKPPQKSRRVILEDSDESEDSEDDAAPKKSWLILRQRHLKTLETMLAVAAKKSMGKKGRSRAQASPLVVRMPKPKAIRWVEADLRRLQLGLRAVKPGLEDEEGWGKIARSLGEPLDSLPWTRIRQKANEVFGYDLQLENDAEQERIRARAAADRSASLHHRRRHPDASRLSATANVSALDASSLPSFQQPSATAFQLESLAELDEDDLADMLTPVRQSQHPKAGRAEHRFLPTRPSESDTPVASPATDPDTPGFATRAVYAARSRAVARRHHAGHSSSSLTQSRMPPPSPAAAASFRRNLDAASRKVPPLMSQLIWEVAQCARVIVGGGGAAGSAKSGGEQQWGGG